MSFKSNVLAALLGLTITVPAWAGDTIMVQDPYIRSSSANAPTGAAFMTLMNMGSENDRLIGVRSAISKRVELHTHIENTNGVMQMRQIKEGILVPADGHHILKRGGDHVMFMGLSQSLKQGSVISLTLTFENAGDITIDVLVDHTRKPGDHSHGSNHTPDG